MPETTQPPKLQSLEYLLGVVFDARRAVYFREHRLLAVADLHLGYAWTHRAQGQLMPVAPKDNVLDRLKTLVTDYDPERIVLLGDIVHRALPVPALLEELRTLVEIADGKRELILLAGNHDRKLQQLLKQLDCGAALRTEYVAGENVLLHGDRPATQAASRFVIGHEHPAISLGDGVATSRKFPCFLIAENVVTLPSFSSWSAHTAFPSYEFMSPIARAARFQTALAILGDRLLPVPLKR
ncbi:MAG TPA: metallophosphoesterase [Verrucomicrobiae bacterium]|nr:metallophosphoesterase [Verrucomicrobiae bacterium]